jgi:hypothetical protein
MESNLLATCIQRYVEADERARAMVGGLSNGQANWKPGPRIWSVAQCLEHLNKGAEMYVDRMGPVIKQARTDNRTGAEPYRKGPFTGHLMVAFLRKNPKRYRFKAPGNLQPGASDLDSKTLLERFLELNARLRELAEQADGLALGHIRYRSPVNRLVRVSLAQSFDLHAVHHHRHLDQVERITRNEAFPAG